jgi:hypothetical protein
MDSFTFSDLGKSIKSILSYEYNVYIDYHKSYDFPISQLCVWGSSAGYAEMLSGCMTNLV